MAENSKIEWTHHTFNPWRGCTKISDGCKNCYAETLSKRSPSILGVWGDNGTRVVASESMWKQPVKWNRDAAAAGERPRVFCASLADVFEDRSELVAPRQRLFELIDRTPNLDWLLLTKRPENIKRLWPFGWYDDQFTWANIWLGTTVENQEQSDTRIPELLGIPAAVRFLSCEPLLGQVNLSLRNRQSTCPTCKGEGRILDPYHSQHPSQTGDGEDQDWCLDCSERDEKREGIHWVIVGGESGTGARPMHPDWARSLRDQCAAAGVPFFFKQRGEFSAPDDLNTGLIDSYGKVRGMEYVNLDGTHGGITLEADGYDYPSPENKQWHWDCDSGDRSQVKSGAVFVQRIGKKLAGRLLDDREWNEMP